MPSGGRKPEEICSTCCCMTKAWIAFTGRYPDATGNKIGVEQAPGLRKLVPGRIGFWVVRKRDSRSLRSVVVPGGAKKEWEELVGVSPDSPGDFVINLLTKDHGWLAEYFDVLSRLSLSQQAHLAEGNRLKHFTRPIDQLLRIPRRESEFFQETPTFDSVHIVEMGRERKSADSAIA